MPRFVNRNTGVVVVVDDGSVDILGPEFEPEKAGRRAKADDKPEAKAAEEAKTK